MKFLICLVLSIVSNAFAQGSKELNHVSHLLAHVHEAPQVVFGSDNRFHLIYEILLSNISSKSVKLKSLSIHNAENKNIIESMTQETLSKRVEVFGSREKREVLNAGESAVLFMHVALEQKSDIPAAIVHEFSLLLDDNNERIERVARSTVHLKQPIIIGPPLKGAGYVAADSCCDSTRHLRAILPINGTLKLAQRYAIDYEQVDGEGKIFVGSRDDLASFHIYGKEVFAVADAVVVSSENTMPDAKAGEFPPGITVYNADGNSVVLKLAPRVYALYAHMKPGSVRVKVGDRLKRGQVIGLVGNSGNSLAPHLHFHLMDGPSPLNSNGLPYVVDAFSFTAQASSTQDFDKAEATGIAVPIKRFEVAKKMVKKLPMDLNVVNFIF